MTAWLADLVAARVRGAMRERSISVERLAVELGMSRGSLSDRLRGDRAFKLDELRPVSGALGVPIEYLIGGSAGAPSPEAVQLEIRDLLGRILGALEEAQHVEELVIRQHVELGLEEGRGGDPEDLNRVTVGRPGGDPGAAVSVDPDQQGDQVDVADVEADLVEPGRGDRQRSHGVSHSSVGGPPEGTARQVGADPAAPYTLPTLQERADNGQQILAALQALAFTRGQTVAEMLR